MPDAGITVAGLASALQSRLKPSGRLCGRISEPSQRDCDWIIAATVSLFSGTTGNPQIGQYDKPIDFFPVFL
jgi:hypothetical protein